MHTMPAYLLRCALAMDKRMFARAGTTESSSKIIFSPGNKYHGQLIILMGGRSHDKICLAKVANFAGPNGSSSHASRNLAISWPSCSRRCEENHCLLQITPVNNQRMNAGDVIVMKKLLVCPMFAIMQASKEKYWKWAGSTKGPSHR